MAITCKLNIIHKEKIEMILLTQQNIIHIVKVRVVINVKCVLNIYLVLSLSINKVLLLNTNQYSRYKLHRLIYIRIYKNRLT